MNLTPRSTKRRASKHSCPNVRGSEIHSQPKQKRTKQAQVSVSICIHLWSKLFERIRNWTTVRVQYLKMMNAVTEFIFMHPDELLVARHFQEFHVLAAIAITRDHRVPIWQSLRPAGVLYQRRRQVFVRELPHRFPFRIHFD